MDEAEEIFRVTLPADRSAAEVLPPGEQPLDLPAPPLAAQRPAILSVPLTVGSMPRDEFDALFQQRLVKAVAGAGHIAKQPHQRLDHQALIKGSLNQGYFVGRSTCTSAASGRP